MKENDDTAQRIHEFCLANSKTQKTTLHPLNECDTITSDSFQEYLAQPHINSSLLKEAIKTPLHYKFARSSVKRKLEDMEPEKEFFKFGNLFHLSISNPEEYEKLIVEPKYSLASKEGVLTGIRFWEGIIETATITNAQGKQLDSYQLADILCNEKLRCGITGVDISKCKISEGKNYLKALKEISNLSPIPELDYLKIGLLKKHCDSYCNGFINRLLQDSLKEISFYYNCPDSNLQLKVRPDALQIEENIGVNAIISIKTSRTSDLKHFFSQAASLHYDLSEAMYQDIVSKVTGRNFHTTIMILVQTTSPYAVALLKWSQKDIYTGKYKYNVALSTIQEAIDKSYYPGYEVFADEKTSGLISTDLPEWNEKELLPLKLNP